MPRTSVEYVGAAAFQNATIIYTEGCEDILLVEVFVGVEEFNALFIINSS